jgi:hypothetical protein
VPWGANLIHYIMNTIIEALKKIEFTSFDGDKFTCDNGIELSFTTKLNTNYDLPSVQIIAKFSMQGVYINSWGFDNETEQKEFVVYWKTLESKFREVEFKREDAIKKNGSDILRNLWKPN